MSEIIAWPYGQMTAISYLVVLDGRSVLLDPTAAPKWMTSERPPLSLILATHGHIDHIDRADEWRDRSGAALAIHPDDRDCLTDPTRNLSGLLGRSRTFRPAELSLMAGQVLDLDSRHRLTVLHTPGHTPGCCCFLLQEMGRPTALFSGDTLFAGSVGRTDLGGDPDVLTASLEQLVRLADDLNLTAQDDLTVYPGHGESTGLLREIRTNPYLTALK